MKVKELFSVFFPQEIHSIKMSSNEWIDDMDIIIRSNIEAIGKIFGEMRSKVVCMPFDSADMIEQLGASERL